MTNQKRSAPLDPREYHIQKLEAEILQHKRTIAYLEGTRDGYKRAAELCGAHRVERLLRQIVALKQRAKRWERRARWARRHMPGGAQNPWPELPEARDE